MDILEKLKAFFAKNKLLMYMLPVLLVLIVVAVIYINQVGKEAGVSLVTPTTKAATVPAEDKVSVLPETIRDTTEDEKKPSMVNPFGLPMRLSGVLLNGEKDSYAVIETSQDSYIVKIGDFIEKTWEVVKISKDVVVLKNGDVESVLTFPQD